MKKILMIAILWMGMSGHLWAQQDSTPFRAYLINNEYEVYLRINFYNQNITIPGHELYGEVPGFLGKKNNSFCWVVTSCRVVAPDQAEMQLINDFGSEDLTATLTRDNDSTYTLRQVSGNTIKVPRNRKWQKLPKTLVFKKQ